MSTLDVGLERGDTGRLDGLPEGVEFTVGGVLRRFAAILRDNLGVLLIFAVLLAGVLPYAVGFAYGRTMTALVGTAGLRRFLPFQPLALLVLTVPFTVLLQGAIAHIGTSERVGLDLGGPTRSMVRHFLPNLGIYILSSVAIVMATTLLFVPGVMLTCRWMVSLQAEVVEGTGVRGALRRSGGLTKGHRWQLFGLLLLAFAVSAVLADAQLLLARALVGTGISQPVVILVARSVSIVSAIVYQVGATATYVQLRRAKEGGTTSEIASVFA